MKRKGINRYLIRKIEEIYEKIINTVLINGIYTKGFWTNTGVRQVCLSCPGQALEAHHYLQYT